MDFCCNPTTEEGEHGSAWKNASVCVPPSVEFEVAIMVQLLKRLSFFRYGCLELLAARDNTSSQQPPGLGRNR